MTAIAPLSGIKILDLTKLAPGPHCTMILGDLGAEIIKVEEPGVPTGRRAKQAGKAGAVARNPQGFGGSPYNALNRNKKSIGLNLKSGPGREILLRLAQRVDVLVEEFRPGVAKRLGIGYDVLSVRYPSLIYCACTGYGQDGPKRDWVGHDLNYIATAGALSMLGRKDQPPTIPHNLLADYAGGGMHAAIGVLAALFARTQTGKGQYVDASMLDGVMLLMAQTFSSYYATGKLPRRGETQLDGRAPYYNVYETKDGKFVTIGSVEPWFYANLCQALGVEEYIEDEYNKDKYPEIKARFEQIFKTKTRDEWVELLSRSDICVAPMLTLDEVENDPQVKARKMIVEVDHPEAGKIKQVGISVKLSETPGSIRSMAPKLGQHTDEILASLGYSPESIARWREDGSIR